ncbi:type I toxin-antitoxin system Ibs family toxin [Escherichia coli]
MMKLLIIVVLLVKSFPAY